MRPRSKGTLVDVASPDGLKRVTVIVLDLPDDETAMQVARKVAKLVGCTVVVRQAEDALVGRVDPTTIH